MDRKAITLLLSLLLLTGLCGAQENGEPEMTERVTPDPAPVPAAERAVEGDVVVFKKGTELRGVKVVRHSPRFVEIEYLPGEPVLQIPTTQVAEVIYAERRDRGAASDETEGMLGTDIMLGEEVSPDFSNKLTTPLSEEPLVFENEDYITVVQRLAVGAGIEISLDEHLAALPAEERLFSHTIVAGATFLDFLRKDLVEIAPDIRVIMHYDRLTLQKYIPAPTPLETPSDQPPAPESEIPSDQPPAPESEIPSDQPPAPESESPAEE